MPTYLPIILSAIIIGILVLIFLKVRRIHLATYELLTKAESTNRETRTLYKQMQAYQELSRLLDLSWPLPALRGWAASPDLLLEIAKHMLLTKPKTVLECSSGSSTLVAARCMQIIGEGRVFSLEHDPQYAEATRAELKRQGLEGWAMVITAPLEEIENHPGQHWYCLDNLPVAIHDVGLLVIDGPPQSTCSLARYPAIPRLKNLLAVKATIFLDDAARDDEKEAVQLWLQENPSWKHTQLYCEKGCSKIETAP